MSDCCSVDQQLAVSAVACPRCAAAGRKVGRETVTALAELTVPSWILARKAFRYCATPDCPVVYYGNEDAAIDSGDVRVRLHAKDPGLDVPMCYCFRHTRRTIRDEIARTGQSTASTSIDREIRAGHCACEVRNPSGRCCLGEVRAYERQMTDAALAGGSKREV